jgi:hypothetical protein
MNRFQSSRLFPLGNRAFACPAGGKKWLVFGKKGKAVIDSSGEAEHVNAGKGQAERSGRPIAEYHLGKVRFSCCSNLGWRVSWPLLEMQYNV